MSTPISASPRLSYGALASSCGIALRRRLLRRRLAALLVATALAPALMPLIPDSGSRFGTVAVMARENVSIDRLEIPTRLGPLVLSGISATGSSLGKGDIEALLTADSAAKAAALLKKFDADSFAIKTIAFTMKIDTQVTDTVYDTFEATGIKGGLIEKLSVREMRQDGTSKSPELGEMKSTMRMGKTSIDKLDLAGTFAWVTEAEPTGKAPVKLLHGLYQVESMDMTMGPVALKMGRTSVSGFKARLPRRPFSDILTTIQKLNVDKDDKAAGLQVFASLIDLYSTFEMGEGAVDGMKMSGTDKSSGKDFTATMDKIAFSGGAKAFASVEGIEVKAADGFFRLKKSAFEGDFYGYMLVMLQRAIGMLPEGTSGDAKLEAELRKTLDEAASQVASKDVTYRVEGLDVDLPPAANAKSKDRVKLALGSFSTTLGQPVGAVPTKLDMALTGFKMPIPANSTDKGFQNLRDVGLSDIDLSARIKLAWSEPTMKLAVDDVSAELGKFGRVAITGELANVPRQIFENPQQNWPIAMMTANVQKLSVSIENKGGFDKLLEKTAREQNKTADQLKVEISTMAPAMIGAFMSAHPDAAALSEAVGKFGKSLGALSVVARGATPAGLTAADIMTAGSNPPALLKKIRFEASAK